MSKRIYISLLGAASLVIQLTNLEAQEVATKELFSMVSAEAEEEGEIKAPEWRWFMTTTLAFASGSLSESSFGPPEGEEALGIPDDTLLLPWEYGSTTFQAGRYGGKLLGRSLNLVAQVQKRELGETPAEPLLPEVQINWAFAELSVAPNTSLRLGIVPSPVGIFNETRDIGSLVPFFRAPFSVYRDLTFVSRNVEGMQVIHTFFPASNHSLELSGYVGEWEMLEVNQLKQRGKARAEEAVGGHFWLDLAGPAVRLGGGYQQYNLTGGTLRVPGDKTLWRDWHLSFEGQFAKLISRVEVRSWDAEVSDAFFGPSGSTVDAGYAQLGYRLSSAWSLYGQFERSTLGQTHPLFVNGGFKAKLRQDLAIAVNYFPPAKWWGLKAETHWTEADVFFPEPQTTPAGPALGWNTTPATGGTHALLSFVLTVG